MFGASVTSLGWTLSAPLGVTKPDFSWISTVAAVASMSPNTTQPAELVVPSRVCGVVEPTGVKVTLAVTPATPAVGAGALPTSTSRPEPVGGVMMLDSLTSGRLETPSRGQVTGADEDVCAVLPGGFDGAAAGGVGRAVARRRFLRDFVGRAVDRLGVCVRCGLERLQRADRVGAHLLLGLGGEDRRPGRGRGSSAWARLTTSKPLNVATTISATSSALTITSTSRKPSCPPGWRRSDGHRDRGRGLARPRAEMKCGQRGRRR